MKPADCMRLLGLGETAALPEIKHAYRRLAQQLHPDKHQDCGDTLRRFVEVSLAYRTLVRAARAARDGRPVGTCATCLNFGEVVRGLDGLLHCPRCSLHGRRRFLPLPAIVVARCTAAILSLAASAGLLLRALHHPSVAAAAAALALALLGLLALAVTCLSVIHCTAPDKPSRRRRKEH